MRIKDLDFLRSLAILGVLFRHSHFDHILVKAGWAGVDLFFLLSGFLVSHILFREYVARKEISIGRFLIRRGFKIYPSFYVCILGLVIARWMYGIPVDKKLLLHEIIFVQNYFGGTFGHTWSLNIEEHFYFSLALFCLIIWKTRLIGRPKIMLIIYLLLWVFFYFLRFEFANKWGAVQEFTGIFKTHLRVEGLLMGSIIAYVYNFIPKIVKGFHKFLLPVSILGSILVVPCFVFQGGTIFMNAYGNTIIHLGFGLILIVALANPLGNFANRKTGLRVIYRWFVFIGFHSYAIYLWHLLSRMIFDRIPVNVFGIETAYFVSAIAIGIGFSLLLEGPALRLRERFYPREVDYF